MGRNKETAMKDSMKDANPMNRKSYKKDEIHNPYKANKKVGKKDNYKSENPFRKK
jgi:hypothetical protein